MSKRKQVRFADETNGDNEEKDNDDEEGNEEKNVKQARLEETAENDDDEIEESEDKSGNKNDLKGEIDDDVGSGDELETEGEQENYESKHTLESDEEDEEKYKRLDIDRIQGQEEATEEFEGDTKITPFNMREEMDEGHFDSTGNFIFDKQEEIKDVWLDNINWARVKKDAGNEWHQEQEKVNEDETEKINRIQIYTDILTLLKPGETITKGLRRLGGNQNAAASRRQRWKEKKEKKTPSDGDVTEKKEETSDVIKLTEYVDKLVSDGDFEAYGFTYEKVKHELEKRQNLSQFESAAIGSEDASLDMFAAEIDAKQPDITSKEAKSDDNTEEKATDQVNWEFKWEDKDDSPIYGPCSSEQMLKWVEEGYFKEAVWVRKADGTDGSFYSSRRIDFDLYI